jgi:ABC-type multidrug transport system fused ATPase/permease subunit
LPDGPLAVQFLDVTFIYDDAREKEMVNGQWSAVNAESNHQSSISNLQSPVLQDVSFTLEPGCILGLLGRTGSGKTTISRLLFRFYDPTTGAIRLGSENLVDLRDTTQTEIRRRIGMVTQDVELFHASVRDNLTLFDDTIGDDDILAALDELGLRGWLAGLPSGLDTRLEGNSSLSAGEAQLLALGRVFLADPGLVILDEASSRLDPATEMLIEQAIDKLLTGRSAIIIAHRLGTVQRADEIMILGNGRILEHNKRIILAADPQSEFYNLLQTGLEEAIA